MALEGMARQTGTLNLRELGEGAGKRGFGRSLPGAGLYAGTPYNILIFLILAGWAKIYAQSLNAPLDEYRFPPWPAEDKKEFFGTRHDRGARRRKKPRRCFPGMALRKLGFTSERRWQDGSGRDQEAFAVDC
jgi:hypothetical protein